MNREIKFRAFAQGKWWYSDDEAYALKEIKGVLYLIELERYYNDEVSFGEIIGVAYQYAGFKDKNGVEMYEGDLLNIFNTSFGNEHVHDCVYQVIISSLYGVELHFTKLLWVSSGYNQNPLNRVLTTRYRSLDTDFVNRKHDRLAVQDQWMDRSKLNDYSNYIEIIGNIKENPELLEAKNGN